MIAYVAYHEDKTIIPEHPTAVQTKPEFLQGILERLECEGLDKLGSLIKEHRIANILWNKDRNLANLSGCFYLFNGKCLLNE